MTDRNHHLLPETAATMANTTELLDPVLYALENAPLDDEPETAEERASVARARDDVKHGRVFTTAELKRSLGL